jgi:hypothetical protein
MSPLTSDAEGDGEDIDTQMLQDLVLDNRGITEDSEMLGAFAFGSSPSFCNLLNG